MKKTVPSKKSGAILVIVMVILVAFTLMVGALLQLSAFNERETIQQLRTTQAHWLAEAGLERALSWVAASKDYRQNLPNLPSNPKPYFGELGNGRYDIDVWAPSPDERVIIQSTGTTTNGGILDSVTVQVSFDYKAGIPGAIVSIPNNGTTYIYGSTTINGSVYRTIGFIDIDGTVTELIYIKDGYIDGTSVEGVDYIVGHIPDPDEPQIEEVYFQNLINTAESSGLVFKKKNPNANTNSVSTLGDNIDLSAYPDNTLYVNMADSDDKAKAFTDVETITGPGKLVVYGELDLNSISSIGDGIEIVSSGDITIGNQVEVGTETELFTQGNLDAGHTISGGNVALLALGDITLSHKEGSDDGLYALVYAKGDVTLLQSVMFYGTIISGGDLYLGKKGEHVGSGTYITYDPDVYSDLFHIDFGNSIIISDFVWQEIPVP